MFTKQQTRKFMQERQKQEPKTPPPTPEEIRRMLGPAPTTKHRG